MPKFSDMLFKMCGFPIEGTLQKTSIPVKERIVSIVRKIFPRRDTPPIQRVLKRHTKIMQQKEVLGNKVRKVSGPRSGLMHYNNGGNLKV